MIIKISRLIHNYQALPFPSINRTDNPIKSKQVVIHRTKREEERHALSGYKNIFKHYGVTLPHEICQKKLGPQARGAILMPNKQIKRRQQQPLFEAYFSERMHIYTWKDQRKNPHEPSAA